MSNMEIWDRVSRPPEEALKTIKGGRLSGMTDISPQWRYKILTEVFGPCGEGWHFDINGFWEKECGDEVLVFAKVTLFIGDNQGIPGVGGSKLISMESRGAHHNDEAFKMAVTDALGTAAKMLGVGADIYMGKYDGSKYIDEPKGKILPTTGVFESLSKDRQEAVNEIAQIASEYLEQDDFHGAATYLRGAGLDTDESVACWSKINFGPKQKALLKQMLKDMKEAV